VSGLSSFFLLFSVAIWTSDRQQIFSMVFAAAVSGETPAEEKSIEIR